MNSRIGKGEWLLVYIAAGFLDIAQILIDLTGIGIGFNAVADPFIGLIFAGYFQWRGVSMLYHPTRLLSLLGVTALEEVTGSMAPAWILDVWYIHRTVRIEQAAAEPPPEPKRPKNTPIPAYQEDDNGNIVRIPTKRGTPASRTDEDLAEAA